MKKLILFGIVLLALTSIALAGDPYNESNDIEDYKFNFCFCNIIEAYKAAQCLRYQCSEGDVPEWTLYKGLNNIIECFANEIISNMPEYEAANWG